MTRNTPLSPDIIRARLQELEKERSALVSLLQIYGGGQPRHNGAAPPRAATKTAPARLSGAVASSANGTTAAIMEAVKRHPGVGKEQIVDYVMSRITPTAADPKNNIRTIIRYQARKGKIAKRGDGYYLP